MRKTSEKVAPRGKTPRTTAKAAKNEVYEMRAAARRHDMKVTTESERGRFEMWCRSFSPAVAKVLLSIDNEKKWCCFPAIDTYVRFGWDKTLTLERILEHWEYSVEFFRDMEWEEPEKTYHAAIKKLKAAMK